MRFSDIQQFTSDGNYFVDIPLGYLERALSDYKDCYGLELNPDFQRGHVWTKTQQERWLEFIFRGGKSANIIRFNCPNFEGTGRIRTVIKPSDVRETHMVCVDGLQRITAMTAFLNNRVKLLGHYFGEFEDKPGFDYSLRFNVNALQTRREVLQWYLDINTGGTVHTQKEIERVKGLLKELG